MGHYIHNWGVSMNKVMEKKFIIATTCEIPGIDVYILDIISVTVDDLNMEEVISKIKEKARSIGANGIVGFNVEAANDGNSVKLIGYGTAVKFVESQWAID